MKKTIRCTFLFLVALCLFSCGSSTPKEVVINNKYKLTVPGYMKSTTALNEDASLQYMNAFRDIYVMVIEDTFEEVENVIVNELLDDFPEGFEGFCELAGMNEEDSFIINSDLEHLRNEQINGLTAKVYENIRNFDGIDAYYKIALIEGKDTYYQVVCWVSDKAKDKYEKTINDIVNSFTEL